MAKYRISFKEWRTWMGVTLLGLGTTILLSPLQDWFMDLIQKLLGAQWWAMVITGGIIVLAALFFFRVD